NRWPMRRPPLRRAVAGTHRSRSRRLSAGGIDMAPGNSRIVQAGGATTSTSVEVKRKVILCGNEADELFLSPSMPASACPNDETDKSQSTLLGIITWM